MRMLKSLAIFMLAIVVGVPSVLAFWVYSLISPTSPCDLIESGLNEFVYKEFKGVYIKSTELVSAQNASNSKNSFEKPTTHVTTSDASRANGTVTYKITFHNNSEVTYWYAGRSYSSDFAQNSLIGKTNGISVRTADKQGDSSSTFDENDWIPPQTERDVFVTYTYGSNAQDSCQTKVEFRFDIKMDAVHDEFLEVLNNSPPGQGYYSLVELFNQLYHEDGTTHICSASHPEVIEGLFGDTMVNMDGVEKEAHVLIRRENLDNDTSSGDDYSNSGPKGCEYTLYITVDPLTPGSTVNVYAISYSIGASGMGDDWYQVGELYEGTAPVNSEGSIDYTKWKAKHKTYELADGIEYVVGAPNGDQYDIMNTMEQLISAVDQDIFNQIDNTNIFKKVYDIIKKYPDTEDPEIVGLSRAFEDASKFYRNLNNGQEFKVVRDKYTRAEIIYALQNIQQALDYYYQVYSN